MRDRLVLAADAVCASLAGAAVFLRLAGGVRWHLGGVRLTASSGGRTAAMALIVLVVRHALVPRPSFAVRLVTLSQRVRKTVDDVVRTRHLRAAADAVALSLVVLAFVVDLEGGVAWHVGRFRITLSSGAWLALAALTVWIVGRAVRPDSSALQQTRTRASAHPPAFDWPSRREWLSGVVLVFGATLVLLRQQVLAFTSVPDLGDPLFSMWRLGWVAHQLPLNPAHLFDANIFHPAARTLAYSDAMLLPGLIAAPAIWLGLPLAAVYSGLLLASFAAAGLAMFALTRAITRHVGGAVIAALVFAFDPFRFSHYSHLELEFTFWMPLAVLCVLRTLSTGRVREGARAGVLVALQGLSSLYCGAYLAVSLGFLVVCWIGLVGRLVPRTRLALGVAILIATTAVGLVTIPYWAVRSTIGERSQDEIRAFSAQGRDYLTAPRRSAVYGMRLYDRESGERELFPGTLPVLLGAAALLPPIGPAVLPVAATLAMSVDASLGLRGTVYGLLDALPPFRAFRVPARFRAVAGLYLAVLAGIGAASIARRIGSPWPGGVALVALGLALLVELQPTLELQPLWNHAPDIYDHVPNRQAVLADLPLPWGQDAFWHDPVYMYFSTFHWHPIVNGSSGFAPAWYEPLGAIGREFPSDATLDAFRVLGTEYFVLHEGYYGTVKFKQVVADVERQPRLEFTATSTWEEGECRLYRLRR